MSLTCAFRLLTGLGPCLAQVAASGIPSWQEPVHHASGEQGIPSLWLPRAASAHKAAGVGCLLFSLQPGM